MLVDPAFTQDHDDGSRESHNAVIEQHYRKVHLLHLASEDIDRSIAPSRK